MALPKDKSAGGLSDEEKAQIEEESTLRQNEAEASDKEEEQDSRKRRRKNALIIGGSTLGLVVLAGGIITAVNDPLDWFGDSNDYSDGVVDDTQQPDGATGPPVDDSGEPASTRPTDYPIDIPEFAEGPYNSMVNEESREDYMEEWASWELPEGYEALTLEEAEEAEMGALEGEASEWLEDLGRSADPRLDDEDSEYVGYQWRDSIEEWARLNVPNMESISFQYPSRADNFTNNPDFVYLEDDTFNPLYSFLLVEDIEYFFGNSVQRLLNPVFGEWAMYQFPEGPFESVVGDFPTNNFREMFTEEWWNENIENGDASNLPVLADWNEDNYGGMDLTDGGERWFGEITGHEISVEGSDEDTEIMSSMNIEYTSYDSSGGTVSRTGELEITIVPNTENIADPNMRLIISDVAFSVEGL